MSDASRSLVRFLAFVSVLGLGLQIPALFNPAFLGLAVIVMWVPAMAVVVSGRSGRQLVRRSLARPFPWSMMLAGAFLGWFHKIVSGILAVIFGAATLNADHFQVAGFRVVKADFVALFPQAGEPLPLFAMHFFAGQLVGVVIAAPLLAFGEEIGWRGMLQPHLEQRFGFWKGTLLVGVLWGYWHVGFMLAGYNGGGNHSVLNALVFFPALLVVVSFLYAWLTRTTGSVLPAVCAHAANNSFESGKLFHDLSWWQCKMASLVAAALLALVVVVLFRLKPRPSERYVSLCELAAGRPA